MVSGHRYWFHPQDFPHLFDHYFECAREIEDELKASSAIRKEVLYQGGADSSSSQRPMWLTKRHQLRVVW